MTPAGGNSKDSWMNFTLFLNYTMISPCVTVSVTVSGKVLSKMKFWN